MRADLLEGATRVLHARGAEGLTTNHVAEATGASIGSLYQYFPNKAALLAAVHDRDALMLWAEVEATLRDRARPPRDRFVEVVVTCCRVQAEAVELHRALDMAEVAVPRSPGFTELEQRVQEGLTAFLEESMSTPAGQAERLARYCFVVVTAILEQVAQRPDEARQLGDDTATMLADFLGL